MSTFREWLLEPAIQSIKWLGEVLVATFEEAIADLNTVTDELADALEASEAANKALRDAIAADDAQDLQALADQAAAHAATVEAVTAKLRGLGADPENPVPDTDPLPPVEDPAPVDPPVDEGPEAPVE